MSSGDVADAVAAACLVTGAMLAFVAAIGVLAMVALLQLVTTPIASPMSRPSKTTAVSS
jgi:hypothetical protein